MTPQRTRLIRARELEFGQRFQRLGYRDRPEKAEHIVLHVRPVRGLPFQALRKVAVEVGEREFLMEADQPVQLVEKIDSDLLREIEEA